MATLISFARRHNIDYSIDSICVLCYQTIASSKIECELAPLEENHRCDANGEFRRAHAVSQECGAFKNH
jgi:hypothetical protein